jgi:hypothetical protein
VIIGVAVAYSLHTTAPVSSSSLHDHIRGQLNQSIVSDLSPVSFNNPYQPADLQAPSTGLPLETSRGAGNVAVDPEMVREAEQAVAEDVRSKQTLNRLALFSVDAKVASVTRTLVPGENFSQPPKGLDRVTAKVHSIVKKYAPKHKSPAVLADAIVKECVTQGYDPLFVAAVIKSESTFNATARSHKGAQGLMQIMPATGAWLAKKESLPHGKLTDPGHNLKLGITYLKQLEEQFNGNRVFTLVAYNWGPGHLERASVGKRKIPAESMTYAVRILNDYRRWKAGVI